MIPVWLHYLSIASIALGFVCAAAICVDAFRHPQQMWIMNVVWPVTALFGSVFWLAGYWVYGRLSAAERVQAAKRSHNALPAKQKPFAAMVGEAASHCGAGCSLGDICAETVAVLFPVVAVWLGWHSLFAEKVFAVWVLDFIFAYAFGIIFQYFTIVPMRGLDFWNGIWAAMKADTLSLIAWQVGMYGFMAAAEFLIFRPDFGIRLYAGTVEFWFVMQLAMICGFLTAYPVNWLLIMAGLKEKM